MLAKLPVERQKLLEAADIIEERGHCKETITNSAGNVCLYGALNIAFNEGARATSEASFQGLVAVGKYLGKDSNPISWNNAPERTKEEVVSALRAAALHGL